MLLLDGPAGNSERQTARPGQIDVVVSGNLALAYLIIDDCFIEDH